MLLLGNEKRGEGSGERENDVGEERERLRGEGFGWLKAGLRP